MDNAAEGPVKVHAQHNEVLGEHHNAKHYRRQLLNDLGAHMQMSRIKNKLKDFILMGDMNENVENTPILNFMNENGLINIHKHKNDIDPNELDKTYN